MRNTEAKEQSFRAGQKIILTGWIGLDGMLCVLEKTGLPYAGEGPG